MIQIHLESDFPTYRILVVLMDGKNSSNRPVIMGLLTNDYMHLNLHMRLKHF